MKKIIIIIDLTIILLLSGCDRSGNLSTIETQLIFDRAEMNGRLSNEGFNRCMSYVNGWLRLADSATGLILRNINDKPSKDIWNAKDCAVGGALIAQLAGRLLQNLGMDGYVLPFIIASVGYFIALAIMHLLIPKIQPLNI